MRIPLLSGFNRKIGLDLGADRIRIVVSGIGLVADEPSRIALNSQTRKMVAYGEDAKEMEGRINPPLSVIAPIQKGVVFDHKATAQLIQALLQRVFPRSPLVSPVFMASISGIAQPADHIVLNDVLYGFGAREVYLMSAPLAASIGAGVPIADASGCFLLHLGESVVEGAVIALGSTVKQVYSVMAGNFLRQKVQLVAKRKLHLILSAEVAQQVIDHVLTVDPDKDREQLIAGSDLQTGSPKELLVQSKDFLAELQPVVDSYVELLRTLLSDIPPQLTVDVIDKGLLLSGGLGQLDGLEQYLVANLGIPVSLVEHPSRVVISGIQTALVHLDEYKQSLGYRQQQA